MDKKIIEVAVLKDSGDATPVTNVMAQISDWVITHPNVLNAAFLNYGKDNVLYTEGYQLDQFFCKRIALRELLTSSCHNRIGAKSLRGHRSSDFPYNITGIQYACSPRPIASHFFASNDLTLNDVKAVVVPYTCCGGIPVLAAQKNNILVIGVRENKTVLDVTPDKLGLNNVIVVENYLEAFGIIAAMKAGVALESVRRPIYRIKEKNK